MDFVTVRELRSESAKIWAKLEAGEEMAITRNGKPFAILVRNGVCSTATGACRSCAVHSR
jgi:hypothetical protein